MLNPEADGLSPHERNFCSWGRRTAVGMPFLVVLSFLLVFEASGGGWRPDPVLLQAVRFVESSGGRFLYGDDGVSLGDFQICKAAWDDVNKWRRARGYKVYPYRSTVMNPQMNREYASNYLTILHQQLSQRLGRAPTVGELYAAYNMGMAGFASCKYQLSRVNRTTAQKCRLITRMVQEASAFQSPAVNAAVRKLGT